MRNPLPTLLLICLTLPAGLASAVGELKCVSVDGDVECRDVAVSVHGDASGGFLAVSGRGDARTFMDRCVEAVCPSVAVSGYRGDAHAECHASSFCLAVAGFGHATHEGEGAHVGVCDREYLYHLCYPILA